MKLKDLIKGDTFHIDGKDIFITEVYKMSKKITENKNGLLVLE